MASWRVAHCEGERLGQVVLGCRTRNACCTPTATNCAGDPVPLHWGRQWTPLSLVRSTSVLVGSSPETGDPVTASQPTSGVGKARSTACRESDNGKTSVPAWLGTAGDDRGGAADFKTPDLAPQADVKTAEVASKTARTRALRAPMSSQPGGLARGSPAGQLICPAPT